MQADEIRFVHADLAIAAAIHSSHRTIRRDHWWASRGTGARSNHDAPDEVADRGDLQPRPGARDRTLVAAAQAAPAARRRWRRVRRVSRTLIGTVRARPGRAKPAPRPKETGAHTSRGSRRATGRASAGRRPVPQRGRKRRARNPNATKPRHEMDDRLLGRGVPVDASSRLLPRPGRSVTPGTAALAIGCQARRGPQDEFDKFARRALLPTDE
jgi:hypothetical protein